MRDGVTRPGALVQADQPWGDAQLAELYDAFVFDGDLPLYLELAREQGRRVLEVACGSGRLLVPLARAGFDVVGIDVSPHMLALAQAKLGTTPNARLIGADMRDFRLDERDFDLAIVAVKSFAYLTQEHEQRSCLKAIHAHLRPDGLLAIDFMHPLPEWVAAAPGSIVAKRFVEWPYRWTYRFEAEHLLERAGFTVEAVYGGYQREPFTSSSTAMVFLARAKGLAQARPEAI